ncbi:ferric uptake regulation protein (fur) [Pyrococcus sp. NA2]|uniref:Fur family transcriptional regulator n=1 Tax=Pyrococcus sp. (strain NA2) TaxID=342949 RepID=UPI000209A9AE|nr:Fur family transcriptional regulator [Pyrococcus sp. NA2]AEC52515.1 ferric uptake regulation protein (fur) [Pyrococcus sp. NA2]
MWGERARTLLKENGYKLTPQRLKLITVLEEIGKKHPSITEILEEVRRDFPTISFSTLYSNLLILHDLGLIELFPLKGETRVEVNMEPHINIIEGEEVVDLKDPEIIELITRKTGKKVKLVNVLVDSSQSTSRLKS